MLKVGAFLSLGFLYYPHPNHIVFILYRQFKGFIVLKFFVFIFIYFRFFLKVGHVTNNKQDLEQE